MNLQVLLSIMNENNPKEHLKKMNVKNNYVIINQITEKNIEETFENKNLKKIISVREKGLSKSRNLAIMNSEAEIGLISDDDMVYEDNYQEIILDAYKKHKDADLIVFVVEHEDKKREKPILNEKKLNFIETLKVSSVQLTMNLKKIKGKKICFDENFGSGSKFFMGEENIFLSDCLKKGLKIYYVPQKIGTLRVVNDSKWFKGYNADFFKVKGAVFYRMNKFLYLPLILQFALRKKKLYSKNMTTMQVIKSMGMGAKEYRRAK